MLFFFSLFFYTVFLSLTFYYNSPPLSHSLNFHESSVFFLNCFFIHQTTFLMQSFLLCFIFVAKPFFLPVLSFHHFPKPFDHSIQFPSFFVLEDLPYSAAKKMSRCIRLLPKILKEEIRKKKLFPCTLQHSPPTPFPILSTAACLSIKTWLITIDSSQTDQKYQITK